MQEFKTHREASLYADSIVDSLFDLEEKILPLHKYWRYITKELGKNEFHAFVPRELGNTGFISIPYSLGSQSTKLNTIHYMPYSVCDALFFLKFQQSVTPGFPDKLIIYSEAFFEEYRKKKGLSSDMPVSDVAAQFLSNAIHGRMMYLRDKKYSFTKEGVEIAENGPEMLYITSGYDDSLKLDMDVLSADQANSEMQTYISSH